MKLEFEAIGPIEPGWNPEDVLGTAPQRHYYMRHVHGYSCGDRRSTLHHISRCAVQPDGTVAILWGCWLIETENGVWRLATEGQFTVHDLIMFGLALNPVKCVGRVILDDRRQ